MKWDSWNSAQDNLRQISATAYEAAGSGLLAAILWARGIQKTEEIRAFLSPSFTNLHDPMQMADMSKAVSRIKAAIATGEKVAVYGDYDADGITASVLVADYLQEKGLDCAVYIPDRLEEGYGLNLAALAELAAAGVTLIITVDCGVSAIDETQEARALGMDVVITDHHECQGALPEAVAVVNPKRPDCPYPEKELAGVGVAFSCVAAVEGPAAKAELLNRYGDLLAVGTVADVMDLSGENRLLVAQGLKHLQAGGRPGFRALMQTIGTDPATMQTTGISFGIAPLINAAGRMGSAKLAYSLLETKDTHQAQALSKELAGLNQQRKTVEQEITKEAHEMLKTTNYEEGPIILHSANWHKGVLGIVAARLKEHYQVPVLLLAVEGTLCRGSCRGIEDFDLIAALAACESQLENYGGHQQAAGLTVSVAQLPKFQATFVAYYAKHRPTAAGRALSADLTITQAAWLTLAEVTSLDKLAPCGKGNPAPVLVLENATLRRITAIGGGKHTKLQVEKWGELYECLFFSASPESLNLEVGQLVDLAFTPECNRFRGQTSVQFILLDIAPGAHRSISRARKLCTALQEGSISPESEASLFCPKREDFVRLWHCLEQENGHLQGDLEQTLLPLARRLGDMNWAKAYICLRIFSELGLLQMKEDADHMQISFVSTAQKADLNNSHLLAALRACAGIEESL